jgi:hypothetical protein
MARHRPADVNAGPDRIAAPAGSGRATAAAPDRAVPNQFQVPVASPVGQCYAGPKPPQGKDSGMPLLFFLILVILIAQLGFWKTFSAIVGGVAMIVLFVLLAIALVALAGLLLIRRLRR